MKKIISASLVAGKLSISVSLAQAGGLGKADASSTSLVPAPEISLDEIGAPYEILTPPTEGSSKSNSAGGNGVIYTHLAANKRIDFIINGVRSDIPVHLFLSENPVK